MRLVPELIRGGLGRILCTLRLPGRLPPSDYPLVVVIPPFAEEMNKCRRMITLLCKELADGGVASVVPDLSGTGDSEGDLRDVSWQTWLDDLDAVFTWSESRGAVLRGVLGIRLGCLLGADWFRRRGLRPGRVVFWQPLRCIQDAVKPLLRIKALQSEMVGERTTSEKLFGQLLDGTDVHAAGYLLPSNLIRDQADLDLKELLSAIRPLRPRALLVSRIAKAPKQGFDLIEEAYPGDPYWSSTEIVVNQDIVRRTAELFLADEGTDPQS